MDSNEKTERKSWVKNFLLAQLEPDDFESIGLAAVVAMLCGLGILFYGLVAVTYQLIVDPDALHVAARLDSLSINPDKCFPRS